MVISSHDLYRKKKESSEQEKIGANEHALSKSRSSDLSGGSRGALQPNMCQPNDDPNLLPPLPQKEQIIFVPGNLNSSRWSYLSAV